LPASLICNPQPSSPRMPARWRTEAIRSAPWTPGQFVHTDGGIETWSVGERGFGPARGRPQTSGVQRRTLELARYRKQITLPPRASRRY
jgi:hypothetical protein